MQSLGELEEFSSIGDDLGASEPPKPLVRESQRIGPTMTLDRTWHIRGARARKDTSYEAAKACHSLGCSVFDIDLGTDEPLMNDMALLARALNVNLGLNWCILDVLSCFLAG
jgi:hypothetical protein